MGKTEGEWECMTLKVCGLQQYILPGRRIWSLFLNFFLLKKKKALSEKRREGGGKHVCVYFILIR
jgi:hypothetical protein